MCSNGSYHSGQALPLSVLEIEAIYLRVIRADENL
jgi:hypothetical protein